MRYPNGKVYQSKTNRSLSASSKGKANFAKRGMKLDEMIKQANQWYLLRDKAIIHKKPTPIQVVSVDYPKRSRAVITEAYYRTASTTDYNGIYKGHYLDFEAKQTNLKTKFPLHNIHFRYIVDFLDHSFVDIDHNLLLVFQVLDSFQTSVFDI